MKYKYSRKSSIRRRHFIILLTCSLIVLFITGLFVRSSILKDLHHTQTLSVDGPAQVVGQVLGNTTTNPGVTVTQPTYTISLPSDWKQTATESIPTLDFTSWQSGASTQNTEYLTIYVDKIPSNTSITNLLPVMASGSKLSFSDSDLSEECNDFTSSTPGDPDPVIGKWKGIAFWCNIEDTVDLTIGTGSVGIFNGTTVVGPKEGSHTYLFVYTDKGLTQSPAPFYKILSSFQAT